MSPDSQRLEVAHTEEQYQDLIARCHSAQASFHETRQECIRLQQECIHLEQEYIRIQQEYTGLRMAFCIEQEVVEGLLSYYPHEPILDS